jgi:predicted amidohydrolase
MSNDNVNIQPTGKEGLLPCQGGFLQFDVKQGDPEHNLAAVRQGLASLATSSPGLVVLPEQWGAGFDYQRIEEHAIQTPNLLEAVKEQADRYKINIAGSLPEREEMEGRVRIFNTLYIVGPSGEVGAIRKQRLFAPMDEDKFFAAGIDSEPVLTDLGLLAGVVCFDLRFPELARTQLARGAQLLLVSAQWPAARRNHWRILLQARAIENQVFVIACNRCGTTDETEFGGHSMIVGPDGTILAEAGDQPSAMMVSLDPDLLAKTRRLFTTVG